LINDLGAPIAVTAIQLGVETAKPEWEEYASYVVAAGSGVAFYMGYGGDFVKNMMVASIPWAARNIYDRVKAATGPYPWCSAWRAHECFPQAFTGVGMPSRQ